MIAETTILLEELLEMQSFYDNDTEVCQQTPSYNIPSRSSKIKALKWPKMTQADTPWRQSTFLSSLYCSAKSKFSLGLWSVLSTMFRFQISREHKSMNWYKFNENSIKTFKALSLSFRVIIVTRFCLSKEIYCIYPMKVLFLFVCMQSVIYAYWEKKNTLIKMIWTHMRWRLQ